MERPDFFELKNGEKVKFQQFQLILMQVNLGVDLIVITLFILIGKEIIF